MKKNDTNFTFTTLQIKKEMDINDFIEVIKNYSILVKNTDNVLNGDKCKVDVKLISYKGDVLKFKIIQRRKKL